jgi:hypothetical protein
MINSPNDLKIIFSTGSQATEDAFANLIDSSYNKLEDSILLGPTGLTSIYGLRGPTGGTHFGLLGPSTGNVYGLQGPTGGTHFGLLGPEGGTHIGLFLLSTTEAPGAFNESGEKGQVIITNEGTTAPSSQFMFIHNGVQWFKFEGLNDF